MRLYLITKYLPFAFALLLSVGGFAQKNIQTIEKIVAKVDNQIVLKSEVDMAYLQFISNRNNSFVNTDLRCKVLETLIINKLLLAKAEIDSVEVDQNTVDDQMNARMKYLLQNYGGSEELLAEQYGKTVDELKAELKDQVKDQLIIQRMQGKIAADVKVTPSEVKKFFNSIPKDSLPYFSKEVQVGHIVYKPELDKEAKKEVVNKLLEIKARIENGESFADLAMEYSKDPGSAARGGELGFFKRKELVPEYEAVALNLKPGEISDPVESKFGFHMIQLIEKRGNEYNSRHILMKPTFDNNKMERAKKFLNQLRLNILNDSVSFEDAAFKYSIDEATKATGGYFTDETGNQMIAAENLDPTLYFIVDGMKNGEISAPQLYNMQDGSQAMRIIYLKKKVAPHEANLYDDWQKIQSAALEEKKNSKVNEWFGQTKSEIFIDVDEEYSSCEILTQ